MDRKFKITMLAVKGKTGEPLLLGREAISGLEDGTYFWVRKDTHKHSLLKMLYIGNHDYKLLIFFYVNCVNAGDTSVIGLGPVPKYTGIEDRGRGRRW